MSEHALSLITLGFAIIYNAWDGGRAGGMGRMRRVLAEREGWTDIFNTNARVKKDSGRQYIPLPKTRSIE
eukprot:46069-Eustigmatos_ZCMA.PRE.1